MYYKCTISAVDCEVSKDGLSNVVSNIHWRYSLTNKEGVSVETYGCQSVGEPNSETFKDFEDLSEEDIVSWISPVLSEQEAALKDMLELKLEPKTVTLPPPFIMK